MDAEILKIDISVEAYHLKILSESLKELMENLEFCPCNSEIYEKLEKVSNLSEQIRELVDIMESFKNMSVI